MIPASDGVGQPPHTLKLWDQEQHCGEDPGAPPLQTHRCIHTGPGAPPARGFSRFQGNQKTNRSERTPSSLALCHLLLAGDARPAAKGPKGTLVSDRQT